MAPRLTESRERIIWGELDRGVSLSPSRGNQARDLNESTKIDDDDALEIREISPPPRSRRHSHPVRVMSGSERVSVSLNKQFTSLSNSFVTPRRRPHGPDAGKSIHKAAEAPQISPPSSTSQSAPRRRSLGSTTRMTPAPPPSKPSNAAKDLRSPAGFVHSVPGKRVGTFVSPPRKRKVGNTLEDGVSRSKAPVTAGPDRLSSPPGPQTSNGGLGVRQVARKSASRMALDDSMPDNPKAPAHRQRTTLATKAARKNSGFEFRRFPRESDFENDSDKGSSLSRATSTSSYTTSADSEDQVGEKFKEQKHASSDKAEAALGDDSSDSVGHPDATGATFKIFDEINGTARGKSISVELPGSHYSSPTRSRSTDSIIPAVSTTPHSPPIQFTPSRFVTAIGTRSAHSSPIDNDGSTAPPTALIGAFENLSAYTLHLHRTNRLPFLVRNVRTSFHAWCRQLNIPFDLDPLSFSERLGQVTLTYHYVSPSTELYTYETTTAERECPICSLFGIFPSWEALRKHVLWDHKEIEFEINLDELVEGGAPSLIVRKRDGVCARDSSQRHVQQPNTTGSIVLASFDDFFAALSPDTFPPPLDKGLEKNTDGLNDISALVSSLSSSDKYPQQIAGSPGEVSSLGASRRYSDGGRGKVEDSTSQNPSAQNEPGIDSQEFGLNPRITRSLSPSHTTSQRLITSNEDTDSLLLPTLPLANSSFEPDAHQSPPPVDQQIPVSHRPPALSAPRPRPPTPPPIFDLHGPSHPIAAGPNHPPHDDQRLTYRPTGPHLYDHLSSLPLDVFGHRSWFVLDKEEEIFELTDVLDEDKVMCALWGRWILLNRPMFIKNYLAGVEAFVDEYWHMIHRAAGWGALRAWLMMLVSRRFLKNTEMVQVLKRYNGLVGKDQSIDK